MAHRSFICQRRFGMSTLRYVEKTIIRCWATGRLAMDARLCVATLFEAYLANGPVLHALTVFFPTAGSATQVGC